MRDSENPLLLPFIEHLLGAHNRPKIGKGRVRSGGT